MNIEALIASVFILVGGVIVAREIWRSVSRRAGSLIGAFMVAAGIFAAFDSVYPASSTVVYVIVGIGIAVLVFSMYLFFKKLRTGKPSA